MKKPPKVVWACVDEAGDVVFMGDTRQEASMWRYDGESVHKYILAPAPKRPRAKKGNGR